MRPAAYGGGAAVERIDTHGAVVFLAGDRAYKLKRAVKFPYMDFSTVARRKQMCDAEISLNRRTAPDLYLGVAPVLRDGEGILRLGAIDAAVVERPVVDWPVVDWLVVMRRFDTDGLFDHLAGVGGINEDMADQLAAGIAAFHAAAEIRTDHGGGAALGATARDTIKMLRSVACTLVPEADIARLDALWTASIEHLTGLLDGRRRDGKVRHCHGDLHLRNICLIEGAPTLFDAIEFSEPLACIDVLYDLAFLLMDMEYRGLRPLTNRLFNRYMALSGDVGGVAVLPLFQSLRAGIRAHVSASMAAAQPDADAAAGLRVEVRRYVALANALMEAAPPRLIAVGGLSGSGKSTLAGLLAPWVGGAPGALHVRSDIERKRLMGVDPLTRLGDDAYGADVTAKVYASLREIAGAALAGGSSVVVDAVYADPDERADVADVAASVGVPFDGLWLHAPVEALMARVAARRDDASDATVEVVRQQAKYNRGEIEWTPLDATPGTAEMLIAARVCLGV